jgi:hypothetical protein
MLHADCVSGLCAVSREVVFRTKNTMSRIEANGTQTAREDDENVPLSSENREPKMLEMATKAFRELLLSHFIATG